MCIIPITRGRLSGIGVSGITDSVATGLALPSRVSNDCCVFEMVMVGSINTVTVAELLRTVGPGDAAENKYMSQYRNVASIDC